MQKVKCTKCGEVKPVSEFYKRKTGRLGIYNECKICYNKKCEKYRHTKDGVITELYSDQRSSSKKRGDEPPTYTRDELSKWCFGQEIFHRLYDNWKSNGFDPNLKPSCDRTNDYKGYSLDRLQLMTWDENKTKGHSDRRNGINNKVNKAVIGIHKKTGEKIEFHSKIEAHRQTGINRWHISTCCSEKTRTAGGYYWKLKT